VNKLPKVAIITSFPRAQRVEVYNEMARLGEVDFRVFYLRKLPHGRHWEYGPEIEHDHVFIPEYRLRQHLYLSPGLLREYQRYAPDFMIMTQYAAPAMQKMMYWETVRRRPWVFWAEAPNVRFSEGPIIANETLRTGLRRVALQPLRYANEIWAIGSRAVEEYREVVGDRVPVKNLPYFSDLDRFFAAGEERRRESRVRFLLCGSLNLRKGADVVAEAARVLHDEGLDFELHVVGKGPLDVQFNALPEEVKERIHLYGFRQLDEIPQFYKNSDVLLFPSRHDGWGMTLPEGLAAGMPVVSTEQTGAAVDMIGDGQNGFRLPELTLENLAAAMRRLILQPQLLDEMGAEARQTAGHYTHRAGARRFLDMIHHAVRAYIPASVHKLEEAGR
jgi:glycosyltransferase involved in cell wall biosynthesis